MTDTTFNRVCDILALSETLTDAELRILISREPEYVLLGLIPLVTTLNLMTSLANDYRGRIRRGLIENVYLTNEVLEVLSKYEETELLAAVARHPAIEESLLLALSKHDNEIVRSSASRNVKLPLSRLYAMLDDKSSMVALSATASLKERPDSDYQSVPASFKDYGLRMLSAKDSSCEFNSFS